MTRHLLVIIILIMPFKESKSQSAATKKTTEFALATFDNPQHNFGSFKKGSIQNCEFKFRNLGNIPLVIYNASAGCPCIVTEISKAPVAPGKEGYIKIKVNVRTAGVFNKKIFVFSNAEKRAVVSVSGKVIL